MRAAQQHSPDSSRCCRRRSLRCTSTLLQRGDAAWHASHTAEQRTRRPGVALRARGRRQGPDLCADDCAGLPMAGALGCSRSTSMSAPKSRLAGCAKLMLPGSCTVSVPAAFCRTHRPYAARAPAAHHAGKLRRDVPPRPERVCRPAITPSLPVRGTSDLLQPPGVRSVQRCLERVENSPWTRHSTWISLILFLGSRDFFPSKSS